MHRTALLVFLSTTAFGYELKTDSTGQAVRWAHQVTFVLDSHAAQLLGDDKAFAAISAAVNTVDAASGLHLSVTAGTTTGVGYNPSGPNQNEIVVPSTWNYDENTIAVTLVTVDSDTHQI